MAQKSGFFTALLNAGVYDRTYRAEDYSDNLAVVISNGVLRSTANDLKVTANNLNLTVNAGRAWIKGHYYYNDSAYSLPAVVPPTGGSRIDRVVLRYDNTITVRSITLQYITGTAATSPTAPALTRTDTIYDICLANVLVSANASTVTVIDTRDNTGLCGWVYSTSGDKSFFTSLDNQFEEWFQETKNTLASVTLFKQYTWETTLQSGSSAVQFNIPQYDPETCFVDVYVNGMLSTDYTLNDDILTFSPALTAGTEITVLAYKSIDGTGIMSVADEITELQNQYATISGASKYIYKATGLDDNISLSQIAEAFYNGALTGEENTAALAFLNALGGNTYLTGLASDAKLTVEVVGKLGVTTPAYGSGTVQSRYRYFNLSQTATSTKQIIFDFNKAEKINIECAANTSNIIFYGTDLEIKNVSAKATSSASNCNIQMIEKSNIGRVCCEDCYFEILTSGEARIAEHGTFINCYCWAASSANHCLLFVPESANLIRLIGGTYYAYTAGSGKTAAVMYTYGTETNAVLMAQNINCPTVTYSGYWQQYLSVAYAGKTIIDLVTSTMNSTGTYNTITNQVWLSKA